VLALTLILMVPAYACVRLAAERSDQNVDLLFISTLRPYSIVAGKFFAAFVLGFLIFSCCAPFMTFTYLLRGLDMPTILFVLLIDLLALLFATMLSMLLAAVPGGLVAKVAAIFLGYVAVLIPGCITLINGLTYVVEQGAPDWYSSDFWVISGSFMGGAVVLVGLFFWYTVALVSPPSSNRVLPIRAFVLAFWLASVGTLFLLSGRVSGIAWLASLIVWLLVTSIILGFQFMISVSERDQYGPRLQRQIPRNVLLRIPAFYLYSGSANGLAFTLILAMLTLLIGGLCIDRAAAGVMAHGPAGSEGMAFFVIALVLLLYLYNYGMTAVLLRVYLLGGHLRTGFTWLIHMLLIGVGSSLPAMVAFVFFNDQVGAGTEAMWWKLPSPFLSAYNSIRDGPQMTVNEDFLTVCLWFLGVWWVLVTVLSVPWLVRQVLSFRPRTPSRPAEAAVAEPAAEAAPVPTAELAPAEGVMADPPATSVQTG
jgi:hypothetical protein